MPVVWSFIMCMETDIRGLKTILIVDDEPDIVEFLDSLLKDSGFDTITAANGKEGLEKAASRLPDLIVLDMSMPEKSGVKMYSELQVNPDLNRIPVIILTGLSSEFKRFIKYLEQKDVVKPPAAYFEKPVEDDVFIRKIRDILKKK